MSITPTMSSQATRALLDQRARALARPIEEARKDPMLDLVSFTLARETYAIESRFVVQVFRLEELAPLPGAESPVYGITTWRGDLLTILDLRPILGLPVSSLNDLCRVMVLGGARPEFGILADSVAELLSVPLAELVAVTEMQGRRADLVRGITTQAVLVLDGSALLSLAASEPSERSRA
jgi:purine-binding chemotaxis protein CheW